MVQETSFRALHTLDGLQSQRHVPDLSTCTKLSRTCRASSNSSRTSPDALANGLETFLSCRPRRWRQPGSCRSHQAACERFISRCYSGCMLPCCSCTGVHTAIRRLRPALPQHGVGISTRQLFNMTAQQRLCLFGLLACGPADSRQRER